MGVGAPQGSLPSPPRAREFCKAVGAHLFGPHVAVSKNLVRCIPPRMFINLKYIFIYFCTKTLGTFFKVHNIEIFKE